MKSVLKHTFSDVSKYKVDSRLRGNDGIKPIYSTSLQSMKTFIAQFFTRHETTATCNLQLATLKKGFTLVEMMLSLTLFSIVIVIAFDAMGSISVLRTKVSSKLDINQDSHFAMEKFVSLVKDGGDIDYEEYWNRTSVGTATASGHYSQFSGYGNYAGDGVLGGALYGSGLYYCRSGSGTNMGTGGCLTTFNSLSNGAVSDTDYTGKPARYGEYREQFKDYNSNMNSDSGGILGDENGNGDIRGDDDDEDLGTGPDAFTGGVAMRELYLVQPGSNPERTFFRWNLKPDPYSPTYNKATGADPNCSLSGPNMGSGCLGNIQMLKLVGRDLGLDHLPTSGDAGEYDGKIDTWECNKDFNCLGSHNLPNGDNREWVDLFPDYINVRDVQFFPYPNKDFRYAWKEASAGNMVASYVRINVTLGLSWERRKQIKTPTGDLTLSTTVNLTR